MSVERKILQALQRAVMASRDASSISTMPIKYLARTFEAPNDGRYLECVHIPNNDTGRYWGDERIYRGIFRIVLHWPNKDTGAYPALDYVDEISSAFPKDRRIEADGVVVKIYEEPTLTSVQEGGSELLFPVSLSYRSFQP